MTEASKCNAADGIAEVQRDHSPKEALARISRLGKPLRRPNMEPELYATGGGPPGGEGYSTTAYPEHRQWTLPKTIFRKMGGRIDASRTVDTSYSA